MLRAAGTVRPLAIEPVVGIFDRVAQVAGQLLWIAQVDVFLASAHVGAIAQDFADFQVVCRVGAVAAGIQQRLYQGHVGVGVGVGPVFAHAQDFARVPLPDFQVGGDRHAHAFHSGPQVPRRTDAIAVNAARFQIHHHLGRRNRFQMHIMIGINFVGCQPITQQQIVHRRGVNHPQNVRLTRRFPQQLFEVSGGLNARIKQLFGKGDGVPVAAHGQGSDRGQGAIFMATNG